MRCYTLTLKAITARVYLRVAARQMFLPLVLPLVGLGAVGFLRLFVLALKWMLLGRVRPGQHALWSWWSSRWDFPWLAVATKVLLDDEHALKWMRLGPHYRLKSPHKSDG